MCDSLGIDQPEWSQFVNIEDAVTFAREVNYPVLVRPSYVLSGAAMRVIDDEDQLRHFLKDTSVVQQEHPVVISKYYNGCREIEFDGVASKGTLINYAISEHVEDAGTHSGDATLLLPAQRLHLETHRRVMGVASDLCRALEISGPFNVQFLANEASSSSKRTVKVIECNVRASRTLPFISKTLNVNFVELATRAMLGQKIEPRQVYLLDFDFVACKVPMFSFLRLSGADPHVGVEMQSTGEVACFGRDAHEAFLKGLLASGVKIPREPCGILLSLGSNDDKSAFAPYVPLLIEMGYTIYATSGTASFIENYSKGLKVHLLHSAITQKQPNVTSAIQDKQVRLVLTTPSSRDSGGASAGYYLRRRALDGGCGLLIEIRQAMMLVDALYHKRNVESSGEDFWTFQSWQESHRIS